MNKKIKASIVVMLIGVAWSAAVVILFWLLFLASTAQACDGVYLTDIFLDARFDLWRF